MLPAARALLDRPRRAVGHLNAQGGPAPMAAGTEISFLTPGGNQTILRAIRSKGGPNLHARNVMAYGSAPRARLLHLVVGLALSLGLLSPALVFAQQPAGPVARAVSVQGTVEARRVGQTSWQPVRLNDTYSPGD